MVADMPEGMGSPTTTCPLVDRRRAEGVVGIADGEEGRSLRWAAEKIVAAESTSCMHRWSGRLGGRLRHLRRWERCRAARALTWRRAGALRHVERGDGPALAVDDGEAALQGDLVLGEDAVLDAVGGVGRRIRDGFGATGSLRAVAAAMDSASARALAEVYCASSSASRLESSRISFGFCENQRSTARFIRS